MSIEIKVIPLGTEDKAKRIVVFKHKENEYTVELYKPIYDMTKAKQQEIIDEVLEEVRSKILWDLL